MQDLLGSGHSGDTLDALLSTNSIPLTWLERAMLIATVVISMAGASCTRISQVREAPQGQPLSPQVRLLEPKKEKESKAETKSSRLAEKVDAHGLGKILDKNRPLSEEVIKTFCLAIAKLRPEYAQKSKGFVLDLAKSILFKCRGKGISPLTALDYDKRFCEYRSKLYEWIDVSEVGFLLGEDITPTIANRYPENFNADDVVRAENLISESKGKLSFKKTMEWNQAFQKISSFTGGEVLTFIEGGMDAETLAPYYKALPMAKKSPNEDPFSLGRDRAACWLALRSLDIPPKDVAFYYKELHKTGISDVAVCDIACLQLFANSEVKGYIKCDDLFKSDDGGLLLAQLMRVGVSPQRFSSEMAVYQEELSKKRPELSLGKNKPGLSSDSSKLGLRIRLSEDIEPGLFDNPKIGIANKRLLSVAIAKKLPVEKVVEHLKRVLLTEEGQIDPSEFFPNVINPCIADQLLPEEMKTLEENCGIRKEGYYRYDAAILKLQAARLSGKIPIDPEKRVATMAQATADPSFAYFTLPGIIRCLEMQGYTVNLVEVSTPEELEPRLGRYENLCGKNDAIFINGHGRLKHLTLGTRKPAKNPAFAGEGPTPDMQLKTTDRPVFVRLKERFKPGGFLCFLSCSVGGFKEGPESLAQIAFECMGGRVEVYAASLPTAAGPTRADIKGKPPATFLGSPTIVRPEKSPYRPGKMPIDTGVHLPPKNMPKNIPQRGFLNHKAGRNR